MGRDDCTLNGHWSGLLERVPFEQGVGGGDGVDVCWNWVSKQKSSAETRVAEPEGE